MSRSLIYWWSLAMVLTFQVTSRGRVSAFPVKSSAPFISALNMLGKHPGVLTGMATLSFLLLTSKPLHISARCGLPGVG